MTELMKRFEVEMKWTLEQAKKNYKVGIFKTAYIEWLEQLVTINNSIIVGYAERNIELLEQLTWRKVEDELPEDRQIVLASYKNACGKRRHVRAEYVPRFTQEFDWDENDENSYEYRDEDDNYYIKEGWYELIDNWGDFTSVFIVEGIVDKWLPIPKE